MLGRMSSGSTRAPTDEIASTARLLGLAPDQLIGGLNLVDAARLLGIAPSTLRARALAGEIGYQRDGRAWRFFWWHLWRYLARREHGASEVARGGPSPQSSELDTCQNMRGKDDDVRREAERMGLL